MRVYLDTNIVIYAVEQPPVLGARTSLSLATLVAEGHELAASHLVRMECRVGPLTRGDAHQLRAYDLFFSTIVSHLLDLPAEVFARAAELRAWHHFQAVDALHLATAIEGGCDAFLTNDRRLRGCVDLNLLSLASEE